VKGDVDITKTRYLCEKHFGTNYISNQSRRKMLVHTAVPFPFTEEPVTAPKFNVVGEPQVKKRRRELTAVEVSAKPKIVAKNERVSPEKRVNILSAEIIEEVESEITINKNSDGETYEIAEVPKQKPQHIADSSIRHVYKSIKPQTRPQQFVYIKQRPSTSPVKTAVVQPKLDIEHDNDYYLVEELHQFSSASLVDSEEKVERVEVTSPAKILQQSPQTSQFLQTSKSPQKLENYSEFIFNGEKYVQMPKRVFEAEKEKLRKETEQYKALLAKLKKFVNRIEFE
jgi:hypothetical protein